MIIYGMLVVYVCYLNIFLRIYFDGLCYGIFGINDVNMIFVMVSFLLEFYYIRNGKL